jgi:hypothetical protein
LRDEGLFAGAQATLERRGDYRLECLFVADFVVTCAAMEFRAAFKTNLCVFDEPRGCVALQGLTDSAILLY